MAAKRRPWCAMTRTPAVICDPTRRLEQLTSDLLWIAMLFLLLRVKPYVAKTTKEVAVLSRAFNASQWPNRREFRMHVCQLGDRNVCLLTALTGELHAHG
jgi:hypothetical protein